MCVCVYIESARAYDSENESKRASERERERSTASPMSRTHPRNFHWIDDTEGSSADVTRDIPAASPIVCLPTVSFSLSLSLSLSFSLYIYMYSGVSHTR